MERLRRPRIVNRKYEALSWRLAGTLDALTAGMALKFSRDNARRAATEPASTDPHFHVWVDSGTRADCPAPALRDPARGAASGDPTRDGPGEVPRNEMPAVPLLPEDAS